MISGEKILITGVTGMVATPLAHFLAKENEVWGIARFADPEARRPYEDAGITTRAIDLANPDFSILPNDFTYILHLSWMRADISQLQQAIRTNVEGPGLLFQHCRKAKATLVMSGMGIYSPHEDPWHLYTETDPIGRAATAYAPTSPSSKAGIEAVARFCARAFDMPIVITRLNTYMGTQRTMPAQVIRAVLDGKTIHAPHDPNPQSPIHIEDMKWQLEALLDAASVPATIVNWSGDETMPMQDWARMAGEFAGKEVAFETNYVPGAPVGSASDPTLRQSITGPCRTVFRDEFRKLFDDHQAGEALRGGPNWGAI
ncbi:nucleoside-diphosphate-sugar epimerase [Sphingobium wenxiniae]|uniref:Nucleoside-diphosphate-sugar epimerase n=1 Tax=Sphingobium wenxiniae (strain DSM 21828 / CGMCC 1.7748 / JZ-1) TaxID=595605 RepID=A0A562JWI8_SPHWJ|nr:NAD(P)-dependent oxidoreductase [Sphingobium wenxiniae]MBB6193806.1 nucleoside-diphosphate-sugar epimerase [Sphingobium wenxiniae]TWH87541.1 nucleoside-diphosphate-sugar epimerase [Sphingobium wenxiniae]